MGRLGAAILFALAAGACGAARCAVAGGPPGQCVGEDDDAAMLQITAHGDRAASSLWSQADGRIPVWIWWEYNPRKALGWGLPAYQDALLASWRRFAPSELFDIHFINQTNVRDFLLDFPEETTRMYVEAVTDMIRTGLLARYGGVYFDADILLGGPLKAVTDKLWEADFVSYTIGGQNCSKGTFSSNFMASRKGNIHLTKWYELQLWDVKQRCQPGDIFYQPSCCYTPQGELRDECHIPWGQLGEGNGHRIWAQLQEANSTVTSYCFNEDSNEGFAAFSPEAMWGMLLGEGSEGANLTSTTCEAAGNDLTCFRPGQKKRTTRKNFFCRRAYHLFTKGSTPAMKGQAYETLKQKPWVISKLLRQLEGDEERHCSDL